MNTTIIKCIENKINESDLARAGQIIERGGLVAFPTETVYGLGGNAFDEEASKKIYAAKGRPSDNPLIVHISCREELPALVKEIPPVAEKLIDKYWPGPMTLVFEKSDLVPSQTTGGLDTVAIRMPSHPVARDLIRYCGVPIAAPSANVSGRPSPTSASHVITDLDGKIDMIIDGGECNIGLESTIIDVTGEVPVLLRPGYISAKDIEDLCGTSKCDAGIFEKPDEDFKPKAPGMKYRHYAPSAPMTIVGGNPEEVATKITQLTAGERLQGRKVGVICTEETAKEIEADVVYTYGKREDGDALARSLYSLLRKMDDEGVDVIYAEEYDGEIMKGAITNRMLKAAGFNKR